MIAKPTTWLLAGAALTLVAGAGAAFADGPADAQREAARDAAAAPPKADRHETRRELRVYRRDGDREVAWMRGPEDRADNLADILQLRPDQQPALNAFLDATRPAGHADRMVKLDRGTDQRTTLQRLDEMQAKLAAQQADMQRKIAATRAFYAQLDEQQKKAFDDMPMLMMVGPSLGPTLIPIGHAMPMMREPPLPPVPPAPPTPPTPPPESL